MRFRRLRSFFGSSDYTVRRQFAVATGVLCVTLVVLLAVGAALVGRSHTDRLVRQELAELADTMMDGLQRGMFERFREMRLLARLEAEAGLLSTSPAHGQRILDDIKQSFPHYAWIGLAQADGTVHAATGAVLAGRAVDHHKWFQSGLKGPTVGDVHHKEAIARHLPPTADPRFLSISTPVQRPDGSVAGSIGAFIDWHWADTLRHDFLAPKHDGAPTEIWIVSRDGIVLLGPGAGRRAFSAEQAAAMAQAGVGTMTDRHDGRPALVGFAVDKGYRDYPGLGWIAVARRPADIAFRPVHEIVWALILLGLAMVIVGILLSLAVARRVSAPIATLTEAARQASRDPDATVIPRLTGPLEIAQLSAVLRQLLWRAGRAEKRKAEAETLAEAEARRLEENIDSLRRLAETDPLTGLLNRRALLARADIAPAGMLQGAAVLMLDIDHFKAINDSHGHLAGDAVIRAVAEVIAANVRKGDTVARFGGEEFIVLLPDIDPAELKAQGERIRRAVGEAPVSYEGTAIRVTLSGGGATAGPDDGDIREIVERADAALYEAKREGRNRITIAAAKVPPSRAVA